MRVKTLNGYQQAAATTALGLSTGQDGSPLDGAVYCALGLTGEAGEAAEQVKKAWRNDGEMTPERAAKLAAELGDVLWYLSMTARSIGYSLEDIGDMNLTKLADRKSREVISSEGDER